MGISRDPCGARAAGRRRSRIDRKATGSGSAQTHVCSWRDTATEETADTDLSPCDPATVAASANHQTLARHLPCKHIRFNKTDISTKSSADQLTNTGHKNILTINHAHSRSISDATDPRTDLPTNRPGRGTYVLVPFFLGKSSAR